MAFNYDLPRQPIMPLYVSEGANDNALAKNLQDLYVSGRSGDYDNLKSELEDPTLNKKIKLISGESFEKKEGEVHTFRLTDMKVFKVTGVKEDVSVPIKLQVVGATITWYLLSPKDETSQQDRDKLYNAAGIGHISGLNACEMYWRGTNSFHVKRMHTDEAEAGYNHNHYRLSEGDVTPNDLKAHLEGFIQAEHELGLSDSNGKELFLTREEATEVVNRFEEWFADVHTAKDGEDKSEYDQFWESEAHKFTQDDEKEWTTHRNEEEPCTSSRRAQFNSMSTAQKLEFVKKSTRGLGAELANTRQMQNSSLDTIATVVMKDDKVISKIDGISKALDLPGNEIATHEP